MKNFDFLDSYITKEFLKRAKKIKPVKVKKKKLKFGRKEYEESIRIIENMESDENF